VVLVSDSRKLVFVHIQKTGGNTVTRLLKENLSDIYMVGGKHSFATRGMEELENWDKYFRFAFVRNPWERLVSWYSMKTERGKSGNKLWHYVRENSSNFEEFVYNCTDEVEVRKGVHRSFAYNQLDYVTNEDGNLLVDFIGRLENFDDGVRHVFNRIGVEVEIVPHRNRSRHTHYSAFYTSETEEVVRERFKRDIEYFGYEFERVQEYRAAEPTEEVPPLEVE
jgi:chondroitin 4-sulfotransferase 11